MTPERMAALIAGWVRLYTRGLPAGLARRRIDEIAADLHDEIAHGRGCGAREARIALGLLTRTVRGLPADASWRAGVARRTTHPSSTEDAMSVSTLARRPGVRVALVTAFVLLVPAVAMQVTDAMAWGPLDFALAGALLGTAGLVIELLIRSPGGLAYRAAVAVALVAALMFVWSSLALGIIGEPGEAANAMYLGVPAVAIAAAVAARRRPGRMAQPLLATALAQALITGVALLAGAHRSTGTSAAELLQVNGLFVGLFLVSAILFRRAEADGPPAATAPPPR